MALVQRLISISFTLGTGVFDGSFEIDPSGANTLTLKGLRASAKIQKAGGRSMSELQLTVWGMTLPQMNQLSTYGVEVTLVPRNSVLVQAGNAGGAMSTVFVGTITSAWFDGQAAPDTAFRVSAFSGLIDAVSIIPPTSVNGVVDAIQLLQKLANQMQYTFENNVGQSVMLRYPYVYGSPRNQAFAIAEEANLSLFIDNGILAVWPAGGHRATSNVPTISPADGTMVGYPSWNATGVNVRALFSPDFTYGGQFQIKGSQLSRANALWTCYSLNFDLESMVPGGAWFCDLGGFDPTQPTPVINPGPPT